MPRERLFKSDKLEDLYREKNPYADWWMPDHVVEFIEENYEAIKRIMEETK